MGFVAAVRTCLGKYVTFSGRARRPEYWWFALFVALGSIVATVIDGVLFGFGTDTEPASQVVSPLFSLATFLPLLAAGWRRMHDTGKPGRYLFIPLLVSLAIGLAIGAGAIGMAELDPAGPSEEVGMGGIAIAFLVQVGVTILVIWWLTRPSQPGPNAYGDEPA